MTLSINSLLPTPDTESRIAEFAPVHVHTGSMPVGHTLEDTTQIQTTPTVVDARPSTPTDPDYFEAIVSGRAFVLDDPVLIHWLNNTKIRQTATVVYGLNPQGERVDGLGLTLDTGQTVLIHREDLGHVHSGQLAADSATTPLFERKATGTVTQTPESRVNAELAPRAGVSYLPDVIDPDAAAVVAIVADLRSQGRLRTGMTKEEVFAVVQAEMARRYQYQSDGDQDAWQSAHDTLQRGQGDCEDWSIAMASVLARALVVTGHSPDGVRLHIIADGDQAHMVVEHGGRVWDTKQPDRIRDYSDKPIVTISQNKISVKDESSVDWLLAVRTASGTARSERGEGQSRGPLIFQGLASDTSLDIHRMMHGNDSELKEIGGALAKGEITKEQLEAFLAIQREFDAMRAFFVILMHVVQQRGKWIRLILAIIEGVEESKDPSDHKYSFEGINFNQLTQSILAVFVADIESELATKRKEIADKYAGMGYSFLDSILGEKYTIDQQKEENEAVKDAYKKIEGLMVLLAKKFLWEQDELEKLSASMHQRGHQTSDLKNETLVYFGNGQSMTLADWLNSEDGSDSLAAMGTQFATADADNRPFFDIVEESLQAMIMKGRKLQANIQLTAAALGFRANLQYAVQKISLGYGDFDTGTQAKVLGWRTSRYELFESQFVDQLLKMKNLFNESVNLTLDIQKKEAIQFLKIAQGLFNVVVVPALVLLVPPGLGALATVLGNMIFTTAVFAMETHLETQYNKDIALRAMDDSQLTAVLAAQGIPTQKPNGHNPQDRSIFSAYSAYERVRFEQGKVLKTSLSGQDRWQENREGAFKKLDALFDVNMGEQLLDFNKKMAMMRQSWVQRSLLMATVLQFSIGFSVHDKYANEFRGVSEKMAGIVQSLKSAIQREWQDQEQLQRIQFEREKKKRELAIGYFLDMAKHVLGLGLVRVKALQKQIFFKLTPWHIIYNSILGAIANAIKTLTKDSRWLYARDFMNASTPSLSDAHQALSANSNTLRELKAREASAKKHYDSARRHREAMQAVLAQDSESTVAAQQLEDARLNEARTRAQYERHKFQTRLADYRDNAWGMNAYEKVFSQEFKMVNHATIFDNFKCVTYLYNQYYTMQAARMARYRVMDTIVGLSRGDRAAESINLMSMESDLIKTHTDNLVSQAKEQIRIANKKADTRYEIYEAAIDLAITSAFAGAMIVFQNPAMVAFFQISKEMLGLVRNTVFNAINQTMVYGDTQTLEDDLKEEAVSEDASHALSVVSPQAPTQKHQSLNREFDTSIQAQRGRSGEYFLNQEHVTQFNRELAYVTQAMQLSAQAVAKIAELRYMIMNRIAGGTTSPTAVAGLIMGLQQALIDAYYNTHRMGHLEIKLSRDTDSNEIWQKITADTMHASANILSYLPGGRSMTHWSQSQWVTRQLAAMGSASMFRQVAEHTKPMVGRMHGFFVGQDDQIAPTLLMTDAAKREQLAYAQSRRGDYHGMADVYQAAMLNKYQKQYQQQRSNARKEYLQKVKAFLNVVSNSAKSVLKEPKVRDSVRNNVPRFFAQHYQKNGLGAAIVWGGINGLFLDIPRKILASSYMANVAPDWHILAKASAQVETPTIQAALGIGSKDEKLTASPILEMARQKTIAENPHHDSVEKFKKKSQAKQFCVIGEAFAMGSNAQQKVYFKKLKELLHEISQDTSIAIPTNDIRSINDSRIDIILLSLGQNDLNKILDIMRITSTLDGPDTYTVSENTLSSIQTVSEWSRRGYMNEADVHTRMYSRISRCPSVSGSSWAKELKKLENNLRKATQPDKQLQAAYQAMAVARMMGHSLNFSIDGFRDYPLLCSIVRSVWHKEFQPPVFRGSRVSIPRMPRQSFRLKQVDINKSHPMDDLDGVMDYLELEPSKTPNLQSIDPKACSPDELAIAIFDYAQKKTWSTAGSALRSFNHQDINWKETVASIRRIIQYNRGVYPMGFRARQAATNKNIREFLVGVFGSDGTEFKNYLSTIQPDDHGGYSRQSVDNVLAILTGVSPLQLVDAAKYDYITTDLLVSEFEDSKSKVAKVWADQFLKDLQRTGNINRDHKCVSDIQQIKNRVWASNIPVSWQSAVCQALDKASVSAKESPYTNRYIQSFLEGLNNPALNKAIAERLLKQSGADFVHDQDPILIHTRRHATHELQPTQLPADTWTGFSNARFPKQSAGDMAEYDERGE